MPSRLLLIAAFLTSAAPPVVNTDVPYCFAIKNPPLELVTPKHEAHPRMPDNA